MRLAGVTYLTLIDASSGYHNLKLDEKSSYLSTFSCSSGRYRYIRLLFVTAKAGNMFQKNTEDLLSGKPNVFGIADDFLIAGFDKEGKDHDDIWDNVLQVYRQANLKLNKDKHIFRCISIPLFCDVMPWQGVSLMIRKGKALTEMLLPKSQKELQSFLGVLNFLSKFSSVTAEICMPLQKLALVKADWTQNDMYQHLYDKVKSMVKKG